MRYSLPPGRAACVVAALLAASAIAYALTPRQERAAAPAAFEDQVRAKTSLPAASADPASVLATKRSPAAARPAPQPASVAPSSALSAGQAMRTAPLAESDEPGETQISRAPFRTFSIEEQQALARREAEGLVTVRNPDGSETLNHEGRFAEYAVIRIGPDGKPIFECVPGEESAKHALHKSRPLPPPAMEDR